jgi:hypothetical protein
MSVIITAPVWHSLGTLSDRSASEDAIDRRAANAGEPVHPVVAEADRDGSTHARVPVASHGGRVICADLLLHADREPHTPEEWQQWHRTTRKAITPQVRF